MYFKQGFVLSGFFTEINQPYNASMGSDQAGVGGNPFGETPASRYFEGYGRHGKDGTIADGVRNLGFEFRNDLLTDPKSFAKIRSTMNSLITNLLKNGNPTYPIERPFNTDPKPISLEYDNAVILNWGKHADEVRHQTRVCFSVENCTLNLVEEMMDKIPLEVQTLMKKGLLGNPDVQKLAIKLAKEFDTVLLSTKYARVICDVTRPNTSDSIIPSKVEFFENGILKSQDLSFNTNLSEKEEAKRIKKYYLGYFKAFQHLRNQIGLKPSYWISFRFFNKHHIHPNLVKKLNLPELPDIVLNSLFAVDFAARLAHAI